MVTTESRTNRTGMSAVFRYMNDEYRTTVVKYALANSRNATDKARSALRLAVKANVTVEKYRDASRAPASFLNEPVSWMVLGANDLAAAVLQVWSESHQPLRDLVEEYLRENDLYPAGPPDYSNYEMNEVRPSKNWYQAVDQLLEQHPEIDKDDLLLMAYYASGLVPGKGGRSEPDEQVVMAMDAAREMLRLLPPTAPDWEKTIPQFSKDLARLIETKKSEKQIATELAGFVGETADTYAHLFDFFEWNIIEKFERLLSATGDLVGAKDWAVKLRDLFSEYDPIREIATVRREEMARAPRRLELQQQISATLDEIDALSALPERDGPEGVAGPDSGEPPPPPVSQDEFAELRTQLEQLAAAETELRAEIDRLSAANTSLESDNAQLVVEAGELQSDLAESRNLAEMWRVYYQEQLKTQEDGELEALPEFDNLEQVFALAERRYDGVLKFLLNSRSDTNIPFDKPMQVWDALSWLATTYYRSRRGEAPVSDYDLSLRETCGWRYTPDQSNTTVGQYRDYYETRVGNRRRELREHIGTGNGYHRGTIRIAFDWDTEDDLVVIGYVGRHQRTDAT